MSDIFQQQQAEQQRRPLLSAQPPVILSTEAAKWIKSGAAPPCWIPCRGWKVIFIKATCQAAREAGHAAAVWFIAPPRAVKMVALVTVYQLNDVSPPHWLFVSVCLLLVYIANSQEWTLSRSIPELRLVRKPPVTSRARGFIKIHSLLIIGAVVNLNSRPSVNRLNFSRRLNEQIFLKLPGCNGKRQRWKQQQLKAGFCKTKPRERKQSEVNGLASYDELKATRFTAIKVVPLRSPW